MLGRKLEAMFSDIMIIIIIALYFVPSMIGGGKRNGTSIVLLNLFLGWTVIGWIAALIWAVAPDK